MLSKLIVLLTITEAMFFVKKFILDFNLCFFPYLSQKIKFSTFNPQVTFTLNNLLQFFYHPMVFFPLSDPLTMVHILFQ